MFCKFSPKTQKSLFKMNPCLLNQFEYVEFNIDVNFFSFGQKYLFLGEIWSKNSKQPFYMKLLLQPDSNMLKLVVMLTQMMMIMMMNGFCGMVDRRKAFSLILSRNHFQISSPSRISYAARAGFEPAKNLSSGFLLNELMQQ